MRSTAPLTYRPFQLMLAGRTVNALGNSFAPIALAFAVLDLTGSATDLGFVVGARTIVNVIFLLFGGVLADRLPKNLLLVGSSVLAALTQAAVATLVLTGTATIPLLIGLSALNGMVGALALPASSSMLPLTVPEGIRQQANAISRVSLNTAAILGAPTAGIIVAATSPGWGIAVDAATFVVAGLCFLVLKLPEVPKSADRPHLIADLRTGWSEFRSRTWLWVVVAGFALFNAAWAGGLFILGPLVADDTFGRRAWGFLLAAQTGGMIVGALIAMRLRLHRMLYFGVACCFPLAGPVFLLGGYPHLWLLLPVAFAGGLALEQFGVAWETTMQEHVPADKLARVYSYDMVGSFVAMPVGEMAIGPIAGAAGLEATLIGAGSLMIVAVAAMLTSRDVRELRHKLPEPEIPTVKESVA